jgi:cytochrome b561
MPAKETFPGDLLHWVWVICFLLCYLFGFLPHDLPGSGTNFNPEDVREKVN